MASAKCLLLNSIASVIFGGPTLRGVMEVQEAPKARG